MTVNTRDVVRCVVLVAVLAAIGCGGGGESAMVKTDQGTSGGSYEDLVKLFNEWREFESPPLVDGVPDYSAAAMAAQRNELTRTDRGWMRSIRRPGRFPSRSTTSSSWRR